MQKERLQQIPPADVHQDLEVPDSEIMVVLLNMGGPKSNADVRDFQKRLFSDRLLIRFPLSWALQDLFAWLLVTFRSKAAEKRYRLIGGGSPIFDSTVNQAKALQEELNTRGRELRTTFSFNYSSPLPDETIREVKAMGKKYILLLSLYPHYSKATTGSNVHYLKKAAGKIYPEIRFLDTPSYYLHDGYIEAFADRIHGQLKPGESLDEFYLLFSAHGLPLYFLKEGDLYPFQIAQTVSSVVKKLNHQGSWSLAYQSAVGPLQWLKPSIEDMLAALARRNIKKVLVIPISFVADHIETICEIDIEYRTFAANLGIADFRMSKAIECHPGFIRALADSVEKALPKKNRRLI
jgi:ferrochelatase